MLNILIGRYILQPYTGDTGSKILEDQTETIKECFVFLCREAKKLNIKKIVCAIYDYSMLSHSHLSDIFGEEDLKICREKHIPLKLNMEGYEVDLYFETETTLPKNIQNYAHTIFFTPYAAAESIKKTKHLLPDDGILYSLEFYENDLRDRLNKDEYKIIKIN